MRMRTIFLSACGAVALGACTSATATPDCDRACLEGFVDLFLESATTNDPSLLPVTDDVRYTENGQRLEIGDALWATADGLGDYSVYFADVDAQQAAFFGLVKEHGNDVLISLRIAVRDGRVSEIENIVSRTPGADTGAAVRALGAPNPLWSQTIPEDERMTRSELIRIANLYFTGMEDNDGQGEYPFTDDCDRLENGHQTTNNPDIAYGNPDNEVLQALKFPGLGCKAQFETGFLSAVTRIRDRRFPLVDVERGVVFAFGFFDHDATLHEVQLVTGEVIPFNLRQPYTWEIGEAFKIEKGEIRFIEAVARQSPYGMGSGWEDVR